MATVVQLAVIWLWLFIEYALLYNTINWFGRRINLNLALTIISTSYDKITLIKVIADLWKCGYITKKTSDWARSTNI